MRPDERLCVLRYPARGGARSLFYAANLAALDEITGQRLWTVAQRTAAALRASGLRCEGVNLFLADGETAFQEVFHVHLHVFPRYTGDGFTISADWSKRPPREALEATAVVLGGAYRALLPTPGADEAPQAPGSASPRL